MLYALTLLIFHANFHHEMAFFCSPLHVRAGAADGGAPGRRSRRPLESGLLYAGFGAGKTKKGGGVNVAVGCVHGKPVHPLYNFTTKYHAMN